MHQLIQLTEGRFEGDIPMFVIYDGRLYRTVNHPLGWADLPDYEIRDDGCIYRTGHHPFGAGETPDYEFRKDGVYRTPSHPEGPSPLPDFALM